MHVLLKSMVWNAKVPSGMFFFLGSDLGKILTIDQVKRRDWLLENECSLLES